MVKILARVLIVLLAAGLVIGATYAISLNASSALPGGVDGISDGERPDFGNLPTDDSGALQAPAQGERTGRGGEPGAIPPGGSSADSTGALPDGGFRGGNGEREGGSAFGWGEVLKSLGIIALVTAVVVIVQKVYAWLRRPRKPVTPAPSGV